MEFRRIDALPPYAFAHINALKMQLRRAGEDVIDLGFGNPDIPSPDVAVEKLAEAVHNPRNHRYSQSIGIPNLRKAVADRYLLKWGVELGCRFRDSLRRSGRGGGPIATTWQVDEILDAVVAGSLAVPYRRFIAGILQGLHHGRPQLGDGGQTGLI